MLRKGAWRENLLSRYPTVGAMMDDIMAHHPKLVSATYTFFLLVTPATWGNTAPFMRITSRLMRLGLKIRPSIGWRFLADQ